MTVSDNPGNRHAVYTTPDGKGNKYAGQVKINEGETRYDAVERRLKKHVADESALGRRIGPDSSKAFKKSVITYHKSQAKADQAEQKAYDNIPAARRLNKQRPTRRARR